MNAHGIKLTKVSDDLHPSSVSTCSKTASQCDKIKNPAGNMNSIVFLLIFLMGARWILDAHHDNIWSYFQVDDLFSPSHCLLVLMHYYFEEK